MSLKQTAESALADDLVRLVQAVEATEARTWLDIKVQLVDGRGQAASPKSKRSIIVGPNHTFLQLALAIDATFGRSSLEYTHRFELSNGGVVSAQRQPRRQWHDKRTQRVADMIQSGEAFAYIHDTGKGSRHHCVVQPTKVDPIAQCGEVPEAPTVVDP